MEQIKGTTSPGINPAAIDANMIHSRSLYLKEKMPNKGLALSSVIVGSIAFLIGWMPLLGLMVGAVAVVLGIVALVKKQPKAMSIIGIALGGVAAIASISWTIFAIATTDWNSITTEASTESISPKSSQVPTPTPTKSPSPTKTPEPTKTAPPAKKPTPTKEPGAKPVPANSTSGGLTVGMAQIACENAAKESFPYGVKFHWYVGKIAERLENDAWFLKVEITPKNEHGTKVNGMVMECTITGSENVPEILAFDVY
ncbi:hypothetical protein G7068_06685 [Leucobacter viscericola]|uniref:DUF4190 domain-containing protein n=1 Tax=Leucobacter viscericola TaxID=2714935 RepID=A0A6G7XE80_9MICO|nr:DUF4190 domain-containing protein [Leucobacter viscericola]QIK62920.1 hypothetical protein G7068_06685 [Leucobacter viscericola]